MNNILRQTLRNMRQQPLLTGLTIAGTALAICLIMIVMMTREVQLIDYGNEPNRSRTLYVRHLHIRTGNGGDNYGWINMTTVNGVLSKVKSTERTTFYSQYATSLDMYAPGRENVSLGAKAVNADFFKVFPLSFIEGQPFTEEECQSNAPIALLSQSACRKVFGQQTDLRGKTFMIANHEYRVAGVVEDVSPMLQSAYAEVWVPMSIMPGVRHPLVATDLNPEHNVNVALMAKSRADFPAIRSEVGRLVTAYNQTIDSDSIDLMEQPDDQETYVNHTWSNEGPDMKAIHQRYLLIFVILLIVPAINIASMTQSRMRQRRQEIGLRRAFGATRSTILWQTFAESLLQTLAAGLLGLVLSFAICYFAADFVFAQEWGSYDNIKFTLDASILFSPELYGWALLFCLLLNVLSSIVPAWRASRTNIVEALK